MNLETVGKIGQTVTVKGWIHTRRNMGKLAFLDVRDRSGILQVVLVPSELSDNAKAEMDSLRPEDCIAVTGVINQRGEKQINPNMPTGTVEMLAKDIEVYNHAQTPPFEIDKDTSAVNEELRLKYRYLDLRSERMIRNLDLRCKVVGFMRNFMVANGFLEVETPNMTKGTPEGSREYLVPSRVHPGKFYVLPQSPQQFKQLLMVAGVEKYFQIAKCFRDEDARGDRQMEFTQLDFEMSFVKQEEVMELVERMMLELVRSVTPDKKLTFQKFPRVTYAESMEKYGNDKPDMREDKNNPNELAFCWVVDFPMFEYSEQGRLVSSHHPFTAPLDEDVGLLEDQPLKARAKAYDLVLNGYEAGGGSIRIHGRELQNKIFQILGLEDADIQARFGHMLEAFTYGAPPHGGMAPGIDRLVMLLAGEPNIREVIAFPKTGDARDPMTGAPSELPAEQIAEAHIKIIK